MCFFAEWSEQEVVEKYLKPINMESLAKPFIENKVTGHVLISLEVGPLSITIFLLCASLCVPSVALKAVPIYHLFVPHVLFCTCF